MRFKGLRWVWGSGEGEPQVQATRGGPELDKQVLEAMPRKGPVACSRAAPERLRPMAHTRGTALSLGPNLRRQVRESLLPCTYLFRIPDSYVREFFGQF